MKRTLLTVATAGAVALGSFAFAQGPMQGKGPGGWGHHHGNMLEHMTKSLDLTPDQQAKVQPILDQAKPQMIAIHQEAMQKMKDLMDKTMAQIRPLLTPDQQKKADDLQKARQDVHSALKELHNARTESPAPAPSASP
jgi:periplasmic protein CpxP/Spy